MRKKVGSYSLYNRPCFLYIRDDWHEEGRSDNASPGFNIEVGARCSWSECRSTLAHEALEMTMMEKGACFSQVGLFRGEVCVDRLFNMSHAVYDDCIARAMDFVLAVLDDGALRKEWEAMQSHVEKTE